MECDVFKSEFWEGYSKLKSRKLLEDGRSVEQVELFVIKLYHNQLDDFFCTLQPTPGAKLGELIEPDFKPSLSGMICGCRNDLAQR